MKKTNCIAFAFNVWKYKNGDSLLIRKSLHGWFPHVAVIFEFPGGSLEKWEYVPYAPERRWLPPLFFTGFVKKTKYRIVND